MNPSEFGTLVRLRDIDETVADVQSDIRGRHVLDKDGHTIGKVDELLLDDKEHKVRSFELSSGGFLGLGAAKSFIPIDAITSITDGDVHIDRTAENVEGAPDYDPALVNEPRFLESTYGYYGYTPYWGLGYAYPFWGMGSGYPIGTRLNTEH